MSYQQHGIFSCDECPETIDTDEDDFNEARAKLTEAGWRTFKGPDGKWAHACPLCVAQFARDQQR